MRKKIIICCFALLFIIIFFAITFLNAFFPETLINYKNWKTVCIPTVGTIMVPQEWEAKEEGGCVYFLARSGKEIVLFPDSLLSMPDCPIYETDEEISQYELISSAVLSNHVTYGTVANRNKQVRYFINFDGKYREMTYYDWNGVLDKKIVYKIACSFRSEGIE